MAEAFGLQRYDKRGGNQFYSKGNMVSSDCMMNVDMVADLLRPQLEVTKEDIEPIIIMGLYHHRNLIGSRDAFVKAI